MVVAEEVAKQQGHSVELVYSTQADARKKFLTGGGRRSGKATEE
jgi:predicted flavoprotein YhiN